MLKIVAVGLLVGALAVSTASKANAEPWALRLEGLRSDYSSRTSSSYFSTSQELTFDGGNGFSLAGEYRPNRWLGLELSVSQIDLDASFRQVEIRPISFNPTVLREFTVASDSGSFSLRPISFGALVHPLRPGRFDFYVGPQVSWVLYDIGLNGPPDRDAEVAFGGKAGLEINFGQSPWSAGLGYRHLEVQHEGTDRDQYTGIGLDLISAVLTYRFGGR
jgi:opacity protein-like surface antigen